MPKNIIAIFLIIISIFCGTTMAAFMKLAQFEINVYTAVF